VVDSFGCGKLSGYGMSKKFKIAGLGEILWDVYGEQKYLGGAPANFAAHVSQAGHHGIILSRVGDDLLGNELLVQLQSDGMDISGIQKDTDKPTGTVRVSLNDEGVPSFECSRDVAFDSLEFDSTWQKLAGQIDAVLFGTLAQRQQTSRKAIQAFLRAAPQAIKVFDINLRGWNDDVAMTVETSLQVCDVIKLNEEELHQLKRHNSATGDDVIFLRTLLSKYRLQLAAVTLGARGCYLVTDSEYVQHLGFEAKVVDTTGSGDAFAAGLVVKLLEKAPLSEIAGFGNRLGAFVATQKGAVPKWTMESICGLISNAAA